MKKKPETIHLNMRDPATQIAALEAGLREMETHRDEMIAACATLARFIASRRKSLGMESPTPEATGVADAE